ncbi:unnamed protein product [Hydatigera taeniaeformis]|uniref:Uncharacterized protein n=1 Tax=Hydatigena taeniaeformis TaxID=6205 RepID=A0A0R3X7B6_HYDTA|nr:unnamed protein product [Hydatigera taeniaeformis]
MEGSTNLGSLRPTSQKCDAMAFVLRQLGCLTSSASNAMARRMDGGGCCSLEIGVAVVVLMMALPPCGRSRLKQQSGVCAEVMHRSEESDVV